MGPGDQDVFNQQVPTKTITVNAFWIDDTEVTNDEYREFVYWVRDSIARTLLSEQFPEFLVDPDSEFRTLKWDEEIEWNQEDYRAVVNEMYITENERFYPGKELDTRKLIYEYHKVDLRQAARRANSYNYETQRYEGSVIRNGQVVPVSDRSSFLIERRIPVYPDTLCWIRDYSYSYNEPFALRYFSHPAYGDYPVVGVTWEQARAFCNWRTEKKNRFQKMIKQAPVADYRLPTEAEWEYAARGGQTQTVYPWGSYYTRSKEGCFVANFKPMRGNYVSDNRYSVSTVEVGTYDPNDYGLFDMGGNVSEWTVNAFDESAYNFTGDYNPVFEYEASPDDPAVLKRKVVRGGSWKDIAYFLQVGTRDYEYQDSAKSYIGFRCVRSSFSEKDHFILPY